MSYNDKEREKRAIKEQEAMQWYIDYKKENGETIPTTEAPHKFSCFDNWIASGQTEFMTEAKVRTEYKGSQIDSFGGAFFEHSKLAGILNYQETNNTKEPILYFNFFADELRIYSIKLDPTMYSWFQKKLPKDSYDKSMIWKWITNLKKEDLIETIKYK